jgi:hypothetical protein
VMGKSSRRFQVVTPRLRSWHLISRVATSVTPLLLRRVTSGNVKLDIDSSIVLKTNVCQLVTAGGNDSYVRMNSYTLYPPTRHFRPLVFLRSYRSASEINQNAAPSLGVCLNAATVLALQIIGVIIEMSWNTGV